MAAAEAEARKVFEEMVDTQARLGEEPAVPPDLAVKGTVNVRPRAVHRRQGCGNCCGAVAADAEQRARAAGLCEAVVQDSPRVTCGPCLTPQIPHPTFPLQVQKIVMDFLKENVVRRQGEREHAVACGHMPHAYIAQASSARVVVSPTHRTSW